MSDNTFRTKNETKEIEAKLPEGKTPDSTEITLDVDPDDYAAESGEPYIVEYFQVADINKDVFRNEIDSINGHIMRLIDSGEIANTKDGINNEIKRLEKLTNTKQESRPSVKIETVSAYIDYLNKLSNIKTNIKRYGR